MTEGKTTTPTKTTAGTPTRSGSTGLPKAGLRSVAPDDIHELTDEQFGTKVRALLKESSLLDERYQQIRTELRALLGNDYTPTF